MSGSSVLTGWDRFFQSCEQNNLLLAFDALVELGMRPLPIVEDPQSGKIKIPVGKEWGRMPLEKRRAELEDRIRESVPVGVGVQPDNNIVLDIDPPGKDRSKLPQAWKEAASILLGSEDWPNTLTISTQAGAHVWFKTTEKIQKAWRDRGKLKIKLSCGGAVEIFTGNDKQIQVACPPSEGKRIAQAMPPTELPELAEKAILLILEPEDKTAKPIKRNSAPKEAEVVWFQERVARMAENVMNADEGDRHDTFRKACRTAGGYAVTMGLEEQKESAYEVLATAHKAAKPDVSDYVLAETFRWGWEKGGAKPLPYPNIQTEEEKPDRLTDLQFADLVIDKFHSRFRYCEQWKEWVTWDHESGVWVRSNVRHYEFFKTFAVYEDSYLGSASKIRAAATLCMSDPRIMAQPDQFDAQHDFINLKNGVLDLETFQLLEHDPAFLCTKQADVAYDPAAKCPMFLETLKLVQPDGLIRSFLQRWLGTTLTGKTLSESVVNYGDGANGKSTILESVGLVLGTYFAKMPRGFIAKSKNERHPAELITLHGARFALASETDISDSLDEAKIKMILGDGTITARGMHENFWSFVPTHKFAIAANHMPSIMGQDSGIWRRLAFVPWNQTIPEGKRKPEYEKTLFQEEASGILNWLLDGLRFYRTVGLEMPLQVKAASSEIRASSDWLSEFYSESLTTKPKAEQHDMRIRASHVYERYKLWAKTNGYLVLPSSKAIPLFCKRAEEMGLEVKKPNNVRWLIGIRFKDENDHENEIDNQ